MSLLDFFRISPEGEQWVKNRLSSDQRRRAAYEANLTEEQKDPQRQQRYLAERRLRGLNNAVFGLGDLLNMAVNAGISDVDYFSGGGLSGGTYDPYQLGMATDATAELASRANKWLTGQDVIDPVTVPGDVRQRGERAENLISMLPTGIEDVGPAVFKAAAPLVGAIKRGKGLLGEVAETASGTLREAKKGITAVSLRGMSLPDAIKTARTERHLIPQADGGFVGAPANVRSMDDIARMRATFDSEVEKGLGGADWYDRIRNSWLQRVAGPDPAAQSELAHNLGLYSSQADPFQNLGYATTARNAAIMDMPPESGVIKTGAQWRNYMNAYMTGTLPRTGKKTGVFARTMDPQIEPPTTGTNDIWHARAFGFTNPKTGKPWNSALSEQQHAFLDYETVLAVDRANARKLGGRSDWTAGEIQAAPWVAGKGRELAAKWNRTKDVMSGKKPAMSEEEGIALAAKTFPDYEEAYTGFGQHEMTPGAKGHLPALQAGDEALRARYAANPRAWWKGPGGRDILYASEGAYTAPTEQMTGIYTRPGSTEKEFNPGQSARPLVAYTGKSGKRVLTPPSAQMMSGTEAFRAFIDAQNAGAYVGRISKQTAGHANAYLLNNIPKDMQTAEGLLGLMKKAEDAGLPSNIIHLGGGQGVLTDFRGAGVPAKERKAVSGIMGELGIDAQPIRREGDLVPSAGSYDWSKEGSDTATKQMLAMVNPAQMKAFEKPEVRLRVLQRMEQDEAFSKIGGGVRKDIQFARRVFAEHGFKGLVDNIGKGLLPAAAIGIFLPYLGGQREREKT